MEPRDRTRPDTLARWRAGARLQQVQRRGERRIDRRHVTLRAGDGAELDGVLGLPAEAQGLVLFAHGSGSSRFSPRNRYVAERLHDSGQATLLIDLLTPEEGSVDETTAHLRFDIALLAERVRAAIDWSRTDPWCRSLDVGLFGASTGAAAALMAAAERPKDVAAVVSRGGRPDLAGAALERVQAPTLLLVGERDGDVLRLNRRAAEALSVQHELHVVAGATHPFSEAGTLEEVATVAGMWFATHLGRRTTS